jgi:hypothetical protein
MKNIGAAMAGGGGKAKPANPDEFFPTAEGTTRAVIPVLREIGWPNDVWECAAGEGHVSKQLTAAGFDVWSTNLTDRGFGTRGVDFLATVHSPAASIVTNPPFSLSDEFLVHALTVLEIEHVCLLLPNGIYHAQSRVKLFELHKPSLILPLTWRLDVTGGGAPTMNCCWYVWTTLVPPIEGYRPLVSAEDHPGRYDNWEEMRALQ